MYSYLRENAEPFPLLSRKVDVARSPISNAHEESGSDEQLERLLERQLKCGQDPMRIFRVTL